MHSATQNERTALVLATEHNHLQVVELLLDSGADPNIQDVSAVHINGSS